MSEDEQCGETTLEELRESARRHYDEISVKAGNWSSFVANAIEAYNPKGNNDEILKNVSHAIGYVHAWACTNLDKGIDPRELNVPELLEDTLKALDLA